MNKLFGSLLLCLAIIFLSGCDKKENTSENSEAVPEVTSVQNVTEISESTVSTVKTSVTETESTSESNDILFDDDDDDGEVIIFNEGQDAQSQNPVSGNNQNSSENIQKSNEEKSEPGNFVSENDDGVIVLPFIPLD